MQKPVVLIDKFLNHEISDQEREILKKWVEESDEHRIAFKEHIQTFDLQAMEKVDSDAAYQKFLKSISQKTAKRKVRTPIYRYAAIFIALCSLGWFALYLINSNTDPAIDAVVIEKDFLPQEQIVLKLADGSTETITTAANGIVTDKEGNIIANTNQGILALNTSTAHSTALNEISIPYGTTYKIQLSDNTVVWLNAGSTLKFPQNFKGTPNKREVFLEGEAFFDVTKNEEKPFFVHARDLQIEVLGTQFNVSSYETDKAIKTTLVEGAVHVFETNNPENQLQLSPNDQAAYQREQGTLDKRKVDPNIYIDWMHNKLIIDQLEFSEILTRLERRYNVRIINNAQHLNQEIYNGEFQNESIAVILNTIAMSTPFTYEINNNIITITK
ncbi:FecR family protein [Spongiimicrobium salis]|uniref:FecR family protein n=1 Tax=Spongiimicrobium salis TaxID=1667022 RepID=UPI00374D0050